ncbi:MULTISPECIES: transglycosylase SLT domain-containing protein [Rhodanobacter]|uniref:transglycosylase SLT domain-containing protein n=1 Tax=Rhodanobacter TaxID=75309 RepID=UPI0004897FBB|nr:MULTISPECIES: transglycosylase SLT domain-containing protein [Rhodanobacter]KZC18647.1 lytic transglycosylase [Rhodanobacter denitrificans]UJJ52373.1 transglycosylase SLT domain-containing protein [Rhodanobacter denitrificans]UJM95126.1 transglycosylase SLT domain-containing protein [Rhodanobacter denitrificans]UJM98657.1 transglycosylase SLT domain-containing protein [Rhodanobacter denitrificans]UJN21928.1 transglycosylase SLT domain-containing protein [Rhodanobacter denitrificans]
MPSCSVVRTLRLAPLAVAISLLAACASTGGARPATPLDALYGELDQASKGYETALQQSREGDLQASRLSLTHSLDRLKEASARCGNTAGCDPQRFFSAFDHLLRLKDGDFGSGQDLDSDVDPAQAALATGSTGAASLPQAQRSVTLLHGQKLSQLIAMNGPVKAALEMWLTQWRPQLMDAWVNYQYLRYQMWPQYQKADLPEALLFGIMAKESGGKVHAVSRSGASGPLQFMYATGMRFGLGSDSGFDLRFDPAASARANAEYINEQLRVFNDNLELALGAYNGGEGRMRRTVGDDTAVSFYDPRIYDQLSQETRDYVPAVLAAAWLFQHPDSYNLRFPKVDGAPGTVTLQRPASLSELTVCLGSAGGMRDGWFRTLRNLNPRLDPQVTQPAGTPLQLPKLLERAYATRCVDGPWPILAGDLHRAVVPVVAAPVAPVPVPRGTRRYTVRRGDTLISIVRKLHCSSVQEVAESNGLKHHRISIGQTLKLPVCR